MLDTSFDGDGIQTHDFGSFDIGSSVVVQPWDDRIVASVVSDAGNFLIRYNTDGSLDTTFGVSGVVDLGPGFDFVTDIATAPGNKLVVLGDQNVNSGDFRVAQLDSNGDPDANFNGGSSRNYDIGVNTVDTASAVAVRGDGRIVVAGTTGSDFVVIQLETDSDPDGTFGSSGKRVITGLGPQAQCLNMTLQPDGSAVLVGQVTNTDEDFAIARVDTNGDLDLAFDTDGMLVVPDGGNSESLSGVVATNTDIFAVGEQGTQGVLLHFTSAGLDADFESLGDPLVEIGNNDGGTNIAFDNSGKLLIIGNNTSGGFTFARYNTDGTADTSFDSGDGSVFGPFETAINLAVQADGRVIIVGQALNTDLDLALARYGDAPVNDVVTVEMNGPDLVITGTGDAESIVITKNTAGINVEVDGSSAGTGFNPTGRIVVMLGDGADQVNVASSVTTPLYIDGGAGNDTIKGGNGHDILVGGPGDDHVMGSGGRDLIIGGTGADKLLGHNDDDIIIAASTAHDSNETALFAIHTEWTSSRSYSVRVNNIRNGSGSLLRDNGSFFFDAVSVVDDGVVDMLGGQAGSDWFIFNEGHDMVTDLNRNEFGDDIA